MDDSMIMERLQAQKEKRKYIAYDQLMSTYEEAVGESTDDCVQEKLLICPEPYTIIRRFDEYESNINKCCKLFSQLMEQDIFIPLQGSDGINKKFWYHSARKRLNIRPGCLNYNVKNLEPIILDEEKKGQLLVVGQAGSGKSELLHNVVFHMLREYSPNEVNLYLANMQFKDKIYSNDEQSQAESDILQIAEKMQHMTNVCEDYNEVRSIVRLLSYAKLCMDDRIQLFSRLGVESLSEFLDKADGLQGTNRGRLVLPRKVFVIDRMYTVMSMASMKEEQTINQLLEDIVMNGAKSGIHIILSCRDISPSWSDTLINGFMHRFVMKCRLAISKKCLDSEEATSLAPGEVLVYDAELGITEKYKTPFIDISYAENIKKALDVYPGNFLCFRKVSDMDELTEEKTFESLVQEIEKNELPMLKLERLHLSFEEIDELVSFVEKKNNTLDFEDFQQGFIRVLEQDEREKLGRFKKEKHDAFYGGQMVVCPEPFSFLRIYDEKVNAYEDTEGLETQDLYWKVFEEDLRNEDGRFKQLDLVEAPDHHMWYNSTDRGINLRPGLLNNNRNNPFAVTMGNEFVHGLVVGRTGAGKSVFLNNLIFNLLYEYAPWELDLFLVDFKKVELSRYMSKGVTPHVNACAATSEVRYVVSMIEYLVNCMNARQNFFSRLGLKDVASFRREVKKRFGVEIALPRVLLLVDEFQQMFLEATNAESDKISNMLTAITKLGRATGYHLLFASQEMSATLSGNVFANFKIRFALLCEQDISSSILGNSAAARIRIGEVLLNTESGAEEDNKLYKVPFINDKNEEFFYQYLRDMRELCEQYGFKKNWKFYEEDRKEKIEVLEKLNTAIYKIKEQKIKESGGRFFDIVTLGSPVVYNNKHKDWETFFIERGTSKNIMVASPNVDDLVYIQKLLAVNFSLSASPNKYQHVYCSLNPIIRNKYKIETDINKSRITQMYSSVEQLAAINSSYYFKANILKAIKKSAGDDTEFLRQLRSIPDVVISDETFQTYFAENFCYESIPDIIRSMPRELTVLKNILKSYENYRKNGNDINAIFTPTIVWISGSDDIKDIIKDDVLKNATSVNMLIIFFASSVSDMDFDVMFSNDYIFIGGNEERFYDKFDLPYTKKDSESIVIDFKIKSLNTCRSFKKFSATFADSVAPSIDFDSLNLGE